MKLYGQGEYNFPSIRRAIVRYLLVCSKQTPVKGENEAIVAKQVQQAVQHLDQLRQLDPKIVSDAERFFVVP